MATPQALDTPPTHNIVVREGTHHDHEAIRAVITAAYQQYEPLVGTEFYTRYLADLTDLNRHASLGRFIVAEIDRTIVGSGVFHADTAVQQFGWPRGWAGGRGLAVHPSQRRSGVARTLIAAAEQLARDCGAPVFAFHTVSFMSEAVALYERLGFRRDPERDQDLTRHLGLATRPSVFAIAYRRDLALATSAGPSRHPRSATLLRCRTAQPDVRHDPSPVTPPEHTMTSTPTRRSGNSPAYYLGRPASFWIRALRRQPAQSTDAASANLRGHR